jgi:hypothetical protein
MAAAPAAGVSEKELTLVGIISEKGIEPVYVFIV